MKITCPHCGCKSSTVSSRQITNSLRESYCHCDNPLCDAGFVMSHSFKHYTRPPKPITDQTIIELVRCLSPQDKKALLAMITSGSESPV